MHTGGIGGGGVRGAQASIGDGRVGSVSGGNFTGRSGRQFAHGGYRGDHNRHRYGRGVGLAAGSALGYGYGGYYDPYYYNDGYAYNDPGYDGTDSSYCALRYRSYDPASRTYLGHDGLRHPCP
jgi:hypothetical protein